MSVMKCQKNFFFNEKLDDCFSCSSICDDIKSRDNDLEYCKTQCPDYRNVVILDTGQSSSIESWLIPLVVVGVLGFIIIVLVAYFKRNQRLNQRSLPLTQEEVGNGSTVQAENPDSGIDTHRTEEQGVGLLRSNENNENSVAGSVSFETAENPQTGLSEMDHNPYYLRTASDASNAQRIE